MHKLPHISLVLIASLTTLAACSGNAGQSDTVKNGVAATQDLSALKNFTRVSSAGPDDVVITAGSAFRVVAEGDPKALEKIEIGVEGRTLKIGRKKRLGISWDSGDRGATIRVTMPAIDSASLTGSGDMRIDRAVGERLELSLTGSGDLTLGDGKVETLDADLTGSGGIRIAGTAKTATLSATGSGDLDAAALKADSGSIRVLGSGDVSLNSSGAVSINLLGSGNATVTGGAKCATSAMGSGEARCTS